MIPPESRDRPVLGFVRNPWSYYVSWYAFQSAMPQPNALFRTLSNDRRLGFEGTIANMLELGSGGPHLGRAIAALPPSFTGRGLNLPGPELAAIARRQPAEQVSHRAMFVLPLLVAPVLVLMARRFEPVERTR